ncbi:MAG: hypothetical protein ACD_46C00488G0003 [uncultured bacterium]|nr:MAG: hypothetical protein ACD_46C00488G0003 [uncultured bacterium]
MIAPRHEIARLQSDFYRDQFRKLLRWSIISVFVMFALIGAIIYLVLFQPVQRYYASTTEGRILVMPKNS